MESFLSLVKKYAEGAMGADAEILERMEPLLKSYAAKTHCMEKEDAMQEYAMAILEALPYLGKEKSEGECIRYLQTVVSNRYKRLCKTILSRPVAENFDSCDFSLESSNPYDDTCLAFQMYIEQFPKREFRYQIVSRFFYEDKKDTEIANELGLSRQYVNRVKKEIIRKFLGVK